MMMWPVERCRPAVTRVPEQHLAAPDSAPYCPLPPEHTHSHRTTGELGAGTARYRQPIRWRVRLARSVQFEHESQCLVDRGEFADRELTHELA